jgi:hypothetical protein
MLKSESSMNALDDARLKWQKGESLDAGRLLFDAVPNSEITDWSLGILELAIKWIPAPAVVLRLARSGRQPSIFSPTPRQHFDAIRTLTLRLERLKSRSHSQECVSNLCYLAENVAKVLANARSKGDETEFDEDAGWWIIRCLYDCAQCQSSKEFFDECEKLLFEKRTNAAGKQP